MNKESVDPVQEIDVNASSLIRLISFMNLHHYDCSILYDSRSYVIYINNTFNGTFASIDAKKLQSSFIIYKKCIFKMINISPFVFQARNLV